MKVICDICKQKEELAPETYRLLYLDGVCPECRYVLEDVEETEDSQRDVDDLLRDMEIERLQFDD